MRRHACHATSLIIMLIPAFWAVPAVAISKDFTQTYTLHPGGKFELRNVNGTVEVQGWDRDQIEIHAVKTAKHKESDLDRVSIEIDAKPDAVSVATRYPQNEGVEVAVEYVVHVPHGARVEHLGTVNGALRISGVETVEDLRTVNGNIEVYESGGGVRAHTTNGSVHIEVTRLSDEVGLTAETMNGSVVLALPPNSQANLETRCLNGNFQSELPISLESGDRPREMRGKLGDGGAPIRLHTVNGGIRVVILRSTI